MGEKRKIQFRLRVWHVYASGKVVRQITAIEERGLTYIYWRHLGVKRNSEGCCLYETFRRWAQSDVSDFWPDHVKGSEGGDENDLWEMD